MLCWRCFHVRAVHVQLPLETSMATDSRDCEGATGFLYTYSHSPTDLVSRDWADISQRLRAAGLGVTDLFRTHYSLQTKAPDGFYHHLCTLLNSFIYLFNFFCIWFVVFSYTFWVWAPYLNMFCIFSVGYLFILLIIEEATLFLFCGLRNLVNFIWTCIHEFTWGSLFWALGLCICFYVNIIQLWFLYLCHVPWNQEGKNFDLCSQDNFVFLQSLMVSYIFLDLLFPFI